MMRLNFPSIQAAREIFHFPDIHGASTLWFQIRSDLYCRARDEHDARSRPLTDIFFYAPRLGVSYISERAHV
jgi:hypothetical protein